MEAALRGLLQTPKPHLIKYSIPNQLAGTLQSGLPFGSTPPLG